MDRVLEAKSPVHALAFSMDGQSLAGASFRDRRIHVWNLESGALDRTLEPPPEGRAHFLSGLPGYYATVGRDGRIRIRNWETGQAVREIAGPVPPVSAVDSPDGKLITAVGPAPGNGSDMIALAWDGEGKERFRVPAGLGGAAALAVSPDGKQLMVAAFDTDLRIWNTRDGEMRAHLTELNVAMFDLAFSPDGKYLASAGVDRTVYLWDAQTWKLARKFTGQPEMIGTLIFSPDGRRLVTGGRNEFLAASPASVLLWDVASGKLLRTLRDKSRVFQVAFAPGGASLAIADGSPTIHLLAGVLG